MKECQTNKIRFSSVKEARKYINTVALGSSFSGKFKGKKPRPYKCHHCGDYHLTTLTKKEAKKAQENVKKRMFIDELKKKRKLSFILMYPKDWIFLEHLEDYSLAHCKTFSGTVTIKLYNH